MKTFTEEQLDELSYSEQYADYIMEHSQGDRMICNGDTLLQAMEDGYLFEDFVESLENLSEEEFKLLSI